ncbi:DUF1552 domain-containing protein [Verrucomicrobiaceae bacterium 227]
MKPSLTRRSLLQNSGVALALPLLESMFPQSARAATSEASSPRRMVFICTTLGLHPPAFWPKTTGPGYESTEYLDLLGKHRDDFTLFSGLAHERQSGRNPHNCEMTWLTGAGGPGLDGFRNTQSIDQVAAREMGNATRFSSIALGSNTQQSQSYTEGGVMIPAETSPAKLFAKMFLRGNPNELAQQKHRLNQGASILDQLLSERDKLHRSTSSADNAQLDEYFESIREAEKDLAESQAWLDKEKPSVTAAPPTDIPDSADIVGRTRTLMNLIPLILQSDSSRVITVMIQDHRVVPAIKGVSGEHHNLSHHGQEPDKIAQLKRIERGLVSSFGNLLERTKNKSENGQRLLDQTSILFGSNLGNANAHDPTNLPTILAGGGFKHGSYLDLAKKKDTPLSNLFVSMLQQTGLKTDHFANSTGRLDW